METEAPLNLCFLGPFIGRHFGYIPSQAQIVGDLLIEAGHSVRFSSASLQRVVRLFEMNLTILRHQRGIDVACLEIYSGRSFVIQDTVSWLCKRLRVPLIMWLHGGALPTFMNQYPRWSRRVLGRADLLVAPSPYLVEAVKVHGFNAQLIPNVVNMDNYPFRERSEVQPKLFWMRSFHNTYNPEMAIDVVAELHRRSLDVRLVMAGPDKGTLPRTKQRAIDLNIGDRVEFPGFIGLSDKISYGNASDIFINTSRIDNMPVAFIEAAALGLPIVSTDVGGIPQLITEGETGLLVPSEAVNEMADAVETLIKQPALTQRLSTNGRALAEKSSWRRVRPQWERAFRSLLQR